MLGEEFVGGCWVRSLMENVGEEFEGGCWGRSLMENVGGGV